MSTSTSSNTFIYLNTFQRQSGTNEDATFDVSRASLPPHYHLTLESIQIPHHMRPFSKSRRNYKLHWQINGDTGTTFTAEMTDTELDREYSGTDFAILVENLLRSQLAADPDNDHFRVDFDTNAKKLRVSSANAALTSYRIVNFADSMHREVGWDTESNLSFTSLAPINTFVPLDAIVNVSGTQYVDIVTNLTSNNWTNSGSYDVMIRVPIQSPFGTLILYEPQLPHVLECTRGSQFRFRLRDDRGLPIQTDFNGFVSYSFVITPI